MTRPRLLPKRRYNPLVADAHRVDKVGVVHSRLIRHHPPTHGDLDLTVPHKPTSLTLLGGGRHRVVPGDVYQWEGGGGLLTHQPRDRVQLYSLSFSLSRSLSRSTPCFFPSVSPPLVPLSRRRTIASGTPSPPPGSGGAGATRGWTQPWCTCALRNGQSTDPQSAPTPGRRGSLCVAGVRL